MSESEWRWTDGGGQERPIVLAELRAALARGEMGPATRVWRAGWGEWRLAIDVPELYAPGVEPLPGPPSVDLAPPPVSVGVAPIVPVVPAAPEPAPASVRAWSEPVANPPRPVPNARATLGFSPSVLGAAARPAAAPGAEPPRAPPVRRISQALTRTDLTAAPDLVAVDLMGDEAPSSTQEISAADMIDDDVEVTEALDALELPGTPAQPAAAPAPPARSAEPKSIPVVVDTTGTYRSVVQRTRTKMLGQVNLVRAPAPASVPPGAVSPAPASPASAPPPAPVPVPLAPVPVLAVAPTPPPPVVLPERPSLTDDPRPSQMFASKTTTLIGQSALDMPEPVGRSAPVPAAGRPVAPAAGTPAMATAVMPAPSAPPLPTAPMAAVPPPAPEAPAVVPTAFHGSPSPLVAPVDPLAATALPFEPFVLDSPTAPSEQAAEAPRAPATIVGYDPGAAPAEPAAPVELDDDAGLDHVVPKSPFAGRGPLIGGGIALVAVVGILALVFRPKPAPSVVPGAASSAPVASAAPSASAATPARPSSAPKAAIGCKVGAPVTIARKAVVSAGAEVMARDGTLAVGYAMSPTQGQIVRLGAGLAPTPAGSLGAGEPVRRVQPVLRKGKLELTSEIDRKVGGLTMRRVVEFDPPFFVGVTERGIAEARDTGAPKELFALQGEGPVEALRVSPIGPQKGVALAFRQGGAVYAGIAMGDELSPRGGLEKAPGLGQIGSPSIAVSGDDWLVVFADRADAQSPWSLRHFGGKLGGAGGASAPKTFELPKAGASDGAISPSLVSLGGGAFLLAWTGGPASSHQVRAQVVDAAGEPAGEAFDVSQVGVNAGQARGAVDASGRGALVYFASKDAEYELVAAPIACEKRSE